MSREVILDTSETEPPFSRGSHVARGCVARDIIVGDDRDSDTGLLGWAKDGTPVKLDMFVGVREHEERAHTISVLGIQKSGKSYTIGAILEMALLPQKGIRDGNALPVIVFHYDQNVTYKPEFTRMVDPTSVAKDIDVLNNLGVRPQGVNDLVVLVPPWRVKTRAADFPRARVEALAFSPHELSQSEWLLLMGVPGSEALYVDQIRQLLFNLDLSGDLSLDSIRRAIAHSPMSKPSKELALGRLNIASRWMHDSCLQSWLRPGRLIVLDIRDEIIDAREAMRLCLICLGLFQRVQGVDELPMAKVIVLDEAHKYVQRDFVKEMGTVVNQMRHTATTVVIASQSPDSIPSDVLEKSSVLVLHQLTSGNQIHHLKKAVQGLARIPEDDIAKLGKGHAMLWASTSTDRRVVESGLEVTIRPRFTRHV